MQTGLLGEADDLCDHVNTETSKLIFLSQLWN